MIEASLSAGRFAARITTAVKRRLAVRRITKVRRIDPSARWRRADWLWPDFAPRMED